jgi:hypothetical protein
VITGFCFGSASTADQPLAETFFALRANPDRRLLSVGAAFSGIYVAYSRALRELKTTGVGRSATELRSSILPSATLKSPGPSKPWSKRLRQWVASLRQIVETVYEKLFNAFGLWRERPHEIGGLRARLAARVALHNFCIWLNDHLGRPPLKFADLMGW